MQWKSANRLYSKRSLQQWKPRLAQGWEEHFPQEALKRGRSLYRKGSIREISIGDEDAIMTCKVGKSENYSVVDWENGQFAVRSSSSDSVFADAIAIAGFLEMEELIADEELLFDEDEELSEGPQSEPLELNGKESKEADEEDQSERILHLILDTHFQGLICEAYWISEDGTRCPALGGENGAPRAENARERGRLIRLAALARKSHFTYSERFNGYLLEHLQEIPYFVGTIWPNWKRSFSTEERENVANIKSGFTEIHLKAKARLGSSGKLNLNWALDSGKLDLPEELARSLMELKGAPALIPELGIVRLSQESKEMISHWEEMNDGKASGFEPYQLFSLFPDGVARVELEGELRKWRDALLNDRESHFETLDCLRPYQVEGTLWMHRLLSHGCHCLLADEMGLGKTVQVISLMKKSLAEGKKALIVCPASVVPVWVSEFKKFVPELKVRKYSEGSISKEVDDWDALVTSFALMRNRIDRIKEFEFEYAVVDEAQFIKNPDAKVTRACLKINARKRIALTGTPIENKPLDIWPTFQFLMPGLLGSRQNFEARLQKNPGPFKARLKAQIAPFMLRRTKAQVASDLSEKIIIDQLCPIMPKQASEYAGICAAGLKRLGDDFGSALTNNRFAALSLLTRLRQASCDPGLLPWTQADLEDSGKLMVLLEKLIEVLGTGHKVVIFSQFVKFLNRIRELITATFPELPLFELTGSTKDRETPVRDFQLMKDTAAMLVSLKAGGSGITLSAADYVFLMDPWWNPAVENQAIDRVHRIGQKNTVFVYRLIAKGTIEERIQDMKRDKQELFESLVRNNGSGLDELARQFKSLESLMILSQID